MAIHKPIEVNKQTKLRFNDKFKRSVEFLNENYNILVPIHDPDKIQIIYKGSDGRYKYSPSFEDVSIHVAESDISISDSDLWKIIKSPNYIEPYNPIKEYFDKIRGTYKGESHIDILCQHIIPRSFDDNTPRHYLERTNRLIRKWLVASVANWLGKETNQVALGLISGREGIGKTTLLNFLIPEQLKEYYVSPSKDDKVFNIEEGFTQYMLVHFEELVGLNKGNYNTFKRVMSQTELLTKPRGARVATYKKRIACVAFSTNKNKENGGFILPSYGDTRRFGCVELEDIEFGYETKVDIDQLWSEALVLAEETDFNYRFDKNTDFPEFKEYNKRYAYQTSAMSCIQINICPPESDDEGVYMNVTQILQTLITAGKISRDIIGSSDKKVNIRTVGIALTALGYTYKAMRVPGLPYPIYCYHIKFLDESLNHRQGNNNQ
ncbi:putative P-loop ATPase [Dysgonomonas sp. PH5-45]|uniref:VapE domain-containing protein n=1 Tax=unclassified Dysgonomonas TaxID=2630389 RepID=UPI002475552B|nr:MULTISPECIES: VapE domain-containing protein [unclassified Dysgonomonas]MDH6355452.1 putative P-loop ATPase [Dysgonomonas sp. PH5-45]MDH6388349.1 putative P-loop ATPase [Dysgonomonas sp. PH5-37]